MKILCVAEKNDAAKNIAAQLSHNRQGYSILLEVVLIGVIFKVAKIWHF